VIFPNEPDTNFPEGGEPLAQSLDTLSVTSVSGEWYNFKMNYSAARNTVYWLGYYSDNLTQYFFDTNGSHLSVTSQTKDENSQWLPVSWHYQGQSIMSLYALYTVPEPPSSPTPKPSPTPTSKPIAAHINSNIQGTVQFLQDTFFVIMIMEVELIIVVAFQKRKKKYTADKL
jgi:hypothetical protein